SSEDEKSENGRTVASPSARKLARELGVDLNNVETRDPLGRVRPDDVKAHADKANQKEAPKEKKQEAPKQQKASPEVNDGKPVERVKMSRRRQTIAKRLVEVQ
ncbi:E3 binding domain-containing protein, partial [Micrococcus sp. SIMBA_144]